MNINSSIIVRFTSVISETVTCRVSDLNWWMLHPKLLHLSSSRMAASGVSEDTAVRNGVSSTEAVAASPTTATTLTQATPTAVSVAATAWTDSSTRERIAGSPLVPDCVQWADDGRVAVVSDASVMISTFMSRELEMFMQQSPAVSKSFIFLPESTENERVPIDIPEFDEVRVIIVFEFYHFFVWCLSNFL